MKKLLLILMVGLAGCVRVSPGYEGIEVDMCAKNEKDAVKSLTIGRYFEWWCEEIYVYPLYKTRYTFSRATAEGQENEEICANDMDGMGHCFDVGITVRTQKGKAPQVFSSYRSYGDNLEGIIDGPVFDILRDSFNQIVRNYKAQEVYASKKGEIRDRIKTMCAERLLKDGLVIDEITINNYRPPASVVQAIEAKVRVDEEAGKARAEGFKVRAEEQKITITVEEEAKRARIKADADAYVQLTRAKAEAEANEKVSRSLNNNLIEYTKWKKWNGEMPTMLGGNSSVLLDMKK